MNFKITEHEFTNNKIDELKNRWFGLNWPVVYILHNKKNAYVGETNSVHNRMKQHLDNGERRVLTDIKIISDKSFNKSAILDIESKLIEYMSADQVFKLQNSNHGLRDHNYYQKEVYRDLFKEIWKKLKTKKIVKNDLRILENSDLFKYTPYKNITDDQYEVVFGIVIELLEAIITNHEKTVLINGEAGTGKTVLAMYFLKLVTDNMLLEFLSEQDEMVYQQYHQLENKLKDLKIALVVPMASLRKTLKKVARKIKGLDAKMVIGPSEVIKQEYDILIVDESHRLRQRMNITNYGAHDQVNKKLNLGKKGTELDWVLLNSKFRILFYDETQSIRKSDIPKQDFKNKIGNNVERFILVSQLRVKAGNDYITYVKKIFSLLPPQQMIQFENYEFFLVDNISDLINIIQRKESEYGLSRIVSGYGFKWVSKNNQQESDINLENVQLVWNKTNAEWINSKNAINEVGSIHTTQGYDLNYIGLIIGPEVTYNRKDQKIEIIRENYYDANGKANTSDEELFEYIMNIYGVLMTRAIKGTYVYVVDENMKNYLIKYIEGYRGQKL